MVKIAELTEVCVKRFAFSDTGTMGKIGADGMSTEIKLAKESSQLSASSYLGACGNWLPDSY